MLGSFDIEAMAATTQPEAAKAFYAGVLGLALAEDTPFALVFTSGRTTLRLQKVESFTPHPFTALGWAVPDIQAAVQALAAAGIACERFNFLAQDDLGIWTAPGGARIAWFKDPDGNTLSLAQSP